MSFISRYFLFRDKTVSAASKSKLCEASHKFDYEKKNVMRSKSSDKRRIHTEYRKHFA